MNKHILRKSDPPCWLKYGRFVFVIILSGLLVVPFASPVQAQASKISFCDAPTTLPRSLTLGSYSPLLCIHYNNLAQENYTAIVHLLERSTSNYYCASTQWCGVNFQIDNRDGNKTSGEILSVRTMDVYSYPDFLWVLDLYNQSGNKVAVATLNAAATSNRPPVLAPIGNKTESECQAIDFTPSASDIQNYPLRFSATGLPVGATLDESSGRFQWSCPVLGNYTITYQVSQNTSNALSDAETIQLTIAKPTPTPAATSTDTATPTPTWTKTQVPTNTSTSTPTSTFTRLPTNTATSTPTSTATRLQTATATPTATATSIEVPVDTPTPTATATATATTACTPAITITQVPPYGSLTEKLAGEVYCVNPNEYSIASYLFVQGWWTKPTFDQPLTPIGSDGTWRTNVVTGGSDQCATEFAAFVLRKDYLPEAVKGSANLPADLYHHAVAHTSVTRSYPRKLHFSGLDWVVKSCDSPLGPDANLFSARPEDVWVDDSGRLHLRIAQHNGQWYSSEVVAANSFGYGSYQFTLAGNLHLDRNAVLGLFTWEDHVDQAHFREIDIELSRWGDPSAQNAQYVIQPYQLAGNLHRFMWPEESTHSVHSFTWQPEKITFASQDIANAAAPELIQSWVYTGTSIPTSGNETPRINLWLNQHLPPSDAKEIEVVVESFSFTLPQPIYLPLLMR